MFRKALISDALDKKSLTLVTKPEMKGFGEKTNDNGKKMLAQNNHNTKM